MSSKIRWVAATALAAGLTLAGGTAAFAGVTPSPSPSQQTQQPQFGYDKHHHVQPVNWQFDLEQTDIGTHHLAEVEGTGAIPMLDWQDNQASPNVDTFADTTGDSVKLWHDSFLGAQETVNRQTCTVTLDQPNGRFRILSGTGTGANKRSLNGRFDLQAMFSFAERSYGKHVVCPLPSDRAILRGLLGNGHGLPQPVFDNVSVQGEAEVISTLPVVHIFAPTQSPSGNDYSPSATPVNS